MTSRIDSASRLVDAPAAAVYQAFATPGALERWLPPAGMTGTMLRFDFRDGGSYRMRLTYAAPQQGRGKTSEDSDEVDVRIAMLEAGRRIEQEVSFVSSDAAFAGRMRMVWTFQPRGKATLVSVRAEDVPSGIRQEDHEAGMRSSLDHLAAFVEAAG